MDFEAISNAISLNNKNESQITNKDIYRQIEALKQIQQMLLSGNVEMAQKFPSLIFQYCFFQGAHRAVRIQSYKLLRQMSSFYQVDWEQLSDGVLQDCQSTQDMELVLNSYCTLAYMPLKNQIEFLINSEAGIVKVLNSENEADLMIKHIIIKHLSPIIIEMQLKLSGDETFLIQDISKEIMIKIVENAFITKQILIQVESLTSINSLFSKYFSNSSQVQSINQEFEGLGSTQQLLKSLIVKVGQHILHKRFYHLLELIAFNLKAYQNLLMLPVYVLRFAFEYQFNLKFSKEDLCIFPPNILDSQQDVQDVTQYQIKTHSQKYYEYLYELSLSRESISLKQEAFYTFLDLQSINNPTVDNSDVIAPLDKNKEKLYKFSTYILDNFNQPMNLIKISFNISKFTPKDQIQISLKLMSYAYQITSTVDRFYVLLSAQWALFNVSINFYNEEASTIFTLFSQQWFIALWNDEQDFTTSHRYKEELCLAIIEAALLIKSEIKSTNKLQQWIKVSTEAAEVCTKALDWKIKQSQIGETVAQAYIMFVEELSSSIVRNQEKSFEYLQRVQTLMFEIYKRLTDEVSLMGLNPDPKNCQLSLIKAQIVLMLSKHWQPAMLEGDELEKLQFLLVKDFNQTTVQSLIQQLLNQVSHSKEKALDMNHGTYLLLNSLFHLGFRFEYYIRNPVLELLHQSHTYFDRIAQKTIKEEELRAIEGIVDMINTVMKYLNQTDTNYQQLASNHFILESERNQGKITTNMSNMMDQMTFASSICVFKYFHYSSKNWIDNFYLSQQQKQFSQFHSKPLRILASLSDQEQRHFRFKQPQLITGISDFVQVYMRYSTNPSSNLMVFHFRIINITRFLLEFLTIELEISENLKIKPFQQNKKRKLEQLSTKEVYDWSVVAKLKDFSDCTCQLRISIPPNESCQFEEDIVIYSLPFSVDLIDLFVKDDSCSHSSNKFQVCFAQLEHTLSRQCFSEVQPFELIKIMSKFGNQIRVSFASGVKEQIDAETFYKVGMQAVTWFGDRLAIQLSGICSPNQTKHSLRVEIRSDSRNLLQVLKQNFDKFMNELSEEHLIVT